MEGFDGHAIDRVMGLGDMPMVCRSEACHHHQMEHCASTLGTKVTYLLEDIPCLGQISVPYSKIYSVPASASCLS